MTDQIAIIFDSDNPTVSGRELHAALEAMWEGRDFSSILRESADHIMGKKFALKERKDA